MKVPVERAESEIIIKKSRFIAIAEKIDSLEQVKDIVRKVREEHPKANHVVHAAVAGKSGTIYSSSDDKEPKNTAGRPALEVLKGSQVTNIVVCIVRYFGGTLLGTGGLVKAYGDAVKAVLENLKTEELREKETLVLNFSYEYYTLLKRLFEKHGVSIDQEDFSTDIKIRLTIDKEKKEDFTMEAQEIDPYISIEQKERIL
ncbi:MAG TPA: YigZ family protein [Candidatus Ornithospirochaeta stercorigallinarum]|nr:YigZ family protein [Candidatus Ornithospirochaeta stercorigallinarum]